MHHKYILSALVSRPAHGGATTYGHRACIVTADSEEAARGFAVSQWMVDGYRLESVDLSKLDLELQENQDLSDRVKVLEAALEPFADLGGVWYKQGPMDESIWTKAQDEERIVVGAAGTNWTITVGQWRAAYEARYAGEEE